MRLEYVEDYRAMSARCAQSMLSLVKAKPDARIILATGRSPQLAYQLFVRQVKAEDVPVSGLTLIKLDEWLGVPKDDASTCEFFLQQELLMPLGIAPESYLAFDPMAKDAQKECERVESALIALGRIDLAILGVGMNGHLGLNEPADQLECFAHPVHLSAQTKRHAMLSQTSSAIDSGMTLGMADLFRAEQVTLLASGQHKVEAMQALESSWVSPQMPVTLLKLHPNVVCWVDSTMPRSFTQAFKEAGGQA